ncbi:MAG: terminase [Deltaproteobacteria bacterium]|nr:terminase [Deltaproteobacteria bacterium]
MFSATRPMGRRIPVPTIDRSRAWVPEAWWPWLSGRAALTIPQAVLRRLRKPDKIPVSVWAEKYRVLTKSALGTTWSNDLTPYLRDIMDLGGDERVEEIVCCKAVQVGFTEAVVNWLLCCVDQDPGDALLVYPDDTTATEVFRSRIRPSIERSWRLSRLRTGAQNDLTGSGAELAGMSIYLGSAQSPAQLGSKPLPYVVMDEIDKYPPTAGTREASPMALAEKRATTYRHRRKIWRFSTPTTEGGNVWQAMQRDVQARFEYRAACPACGAVQPMAFSGIRWPGGGKADPMQILGETSARYHCVHCQAEWDDRARDKAVRAGGWAVPETGEDLWEHIERARPRKLGFTIPAWISPFVSLSECAAAFLKGQRSRIALRDFWNNYAAEPWKEYDKVRSEDVILDLRDRRPRGLVPSGGVVSCLTAAVDTQEDGFWYEIRAWGWGMAMDSWQIREGFLPVDWTAPYDPRTRAFPYHPAFDTVRGVLMEDVYRDEDGTVYPVQLSLIDSGGHHSTEVYDFARCHAGIVQPIKGASSRMAGLWEAAKDDNPNFRSRFSLSGGVRLNTQHLKSLLAERLEIPFDNPEAWRFHAETSMKWATMMCAEYRNDKGLWEQIRGRENHAWDCSVYNLAAAEMLNVRYSSAPVPEPRPLEEEAQPFDPRSYRPRPSWR